jgi:hypothetical protein
MPSKVKNLHEEIVREPEAAGHSDRAARYHRRTKARQRCIPILAAPRNPLPTRRGAPPAIAILLGRVRPGRRLAQPKNRENEKWARCEALSLNCCRPGFCPSGRRRRAAKACRKAVRIPLAAAETHPVRTPVVGELRASGRVLPASGGESPMAKRPRDSAPGTTDQSPRWVGPPEIGRPAICRLWTTRRRFEILRAKISPIRRRRISSTL